MVKRKRRRLTLTRKKHTESTIKTKKIRIRCPACGFLCWQSQLAKEHKLEFYIQTLSGNDGISYQITNDNEYFRKVLANNLRLIAERLDGQQIQRKVFLPYTSSFKNPETSMKEKYIMIKPKVTIVR